jgi:hypothetical protein
MTPFWASAGLQCCGDRMPGDISQRGMALDAEGARANAAATGKGLMTADGRCV